MTRLEVDLGTIGRVAVEGDDAREILKELAFWQSLPTACPVCGAGTRLVYERVTSKKQNSYGKEFDYYRLRCLGEPRHEVTLGVYQDGGGLFYPESKPWTVRRRGADDDLDDDLDDEPAHQAPPAARPAPAGRPATTRPAPAAEAPRAAAKAPPAAAANGAAPGLALRAALTTRWGIRGQLHRLVAEHALGRPVPDDAWRELTAGEAETVERLAAQIADGRVAITELNPA